MALIVKHRMSIGRECCRSVLTALLCLVAIATLSQCQQGLVAPCCRRNVSYIAHGSTVQLTVRSSLATRQPMPNRMAKPRVGTTKLASQAGNSGMNSGKFVQTFHDLQLANKVKAINAREELIGLECYRCQLWHLSSPCVQWANN